MHLVLPVVLSGARGAAEGVSGDCSAIVYAVVGWVIECVFLPVVS